MRKYSSSKIDVANYCIMRFFLKYCERKKPLRLSAYVKGGLFHKIIEEFWSKLGTEEEVAKKYRTKKAYFDSDSFAKHVVRRWNQLVKADYKSRENLEKETNEKTIKRIKNRLIYWRDEGERWTIRASLKRISEPLFDKLIEEGRPVYSELPFDFILFGRRFSGKIDEVRMKDKKIIIRDYKSGKPWIGRMKLNHDPQMTVYNVGLCSLCYDNEEFARTLNLGEERKRLMGNPIYVNENFSHEFFMIEALPIIAKEESKKKDWEKNIKSVYPTIRTDKHFFEVIKMIEGVEKAVSIGNVYPERGRKCDDCDENIACEEKLELADQQVIKDLSGQGFFSFAAPLYMKPIKKKSRVDINTKRFKWKK